MSTKSKVTKERSLVPVVDLRLEEKKRDANLKHLRYITRRVRKRHGQ